MNIGIDVRPLMTTRTGVGEYTYELLNAVFALDKENQYFLFYNSYEDVSKNIPVWKQDNIHYITTRWPNKLFNASLKILGRPRLDCLVRRLWTLDFGLKHKLEEEAKDQSLKSKVRLDLWFSPNLNFTPLSKKVRHLLTIHDLSFEFFPEFFSLKQRLWHQVINPKKQCRSAQMIIVPSQNTKRDLMDYYKIPAEKITVLYPGLSTIFDNKDTTHREEIKQKYSLPKKFILFLGTIEPRKNIPGLIKAFEKAYYQLPADYYLVIAGGDGWKTKKIYEELKKSPLREKIKFIGYVEPLHKPTLYSLASVFVYPSFYEGFGFPVLEAMASGTPTITSNRSSLVEITENASFLIDPNHPDSLAKGLVIVLNNENLRKKLVENGLKRALNFKWDDATKKWLEIIMQKI